MLRDVEAARDKRPDWKMLEEIAADVCRTIELSGSCYLICGATSALPFARDCSMSSSPSC